MAQNDPEVRARILAAMRERRISVRSIARETGLSKDTVSSYVGNRRKTTVGTVALICQHLGLEKDSSKGSASV